MKSTQSRIAQVAECRKLFERYYLHGLERVAYDGDVNAWKKWLKRSGLSHMNAYEFSMIPLVVASLDRVGYAEPARPKLVGMVRYLWTRTELIKSHAQDAATLLSVNNIPSVAIKGLALAQHGVDLTMRPINDGDLVVRPADFDQAVVILKADGWRQTMASNQAITLSKGELATVDLHNHASGVDRGFDAFEWSTRSQPYDVLDPTGIVIVSALHGVQYSGGGQWRFDLEQALKLGIDVDRLVAYAGAQQVSIALETALEIAGSPPELLSRLRAIRPGPTELDDLRRYVQVPRRG